ncbi:5-formyltetrahydrofolate cyclo-ligase [Kushneria sinocarnis]|uniref:5-formyltetrahydrofolate cyclo-ligase n=1 Tax=Kushneria sinocarnis TaxID=595502 RepID=A0A420X0H3_9GAMM|nr:5-formyltetrahydrofolate cyclo-ligase [Kushneria sinocarnis]RKR07343.1 5-formyltetrahydrofolate cyclo-ligase [Kushneria sinocarnis]
MPLRSAPSPFRSLRDSSASDPVSADHDRRALRRLLRRRRRALDARARHQAALALRQHLLAMPEILRASHLAFYLPSDGEIDPRPLIATLRRRGVHIYLPVLRPLVHNRLWFVELRHDTRLVTNRFGIPEPALRQSAQRHRRLPAWALDTILMPLVGFDQQGQRLGMGGGFYDRTLAFTRHRGARPTLIGLAHDCQQVDALPVAAWDVPLDAVVSDRAIIRPHH